MNGNLLEPLAMPRGSVRALLAFLTIGTVVVVGLVTLIVAALSGRLDPSKVFDAVFQLASMAMIFYFVQRIASAPSR